MAETQTITLLPIAAPAEPSVELEQSLPSDLAALTPVINNVMLLVARFRGPDDGQADIELALHEALVNAVIHGNAEDPSKRVYVTTCCNADGEVSITVRDQGRGFDPKVVPDPTTAECKLCTHGRGIHLMRALMDEVSFEEGGTVVHIRKMARRREQMTQPLGAFEASQQ